MSAAVLAAVLVELRAWVDAENAAGSERKSVRSENYMASSGTRGGDQDTRTRTRRSGAHAVAELAAGEWLAAPHSVFAGEWRRLTVCCGGAQGVAAAPGCGGCAHIFVGRAGPPRPSQPPNSSSTARRSALSKRPLHWKRWKRESSRDEDASGRRFTEGERVREEAESTPRFDMSVRVGTTLQPPDSKTKKSDPA